ncbi:MAG: hypothetical protein F7C33_07040 [Desulfurococcales archaeon]|nr:hypothetical protein [Desulfurococcales archaeon]
MNPARSIRGPLVVDIDIGLVEKILREEYELEEARLDAMVSVLERLLRDRGERASVSMDGPTFSEEPVDRRLFEDS